MLKRNRISELNSSSGLLNVKEMRRHETGQKNIKASLSKANIRSHVISHGRFTASKQERTNKKKE